MSDFVDDLIVLTREHGYTLADVRGKSRSLPLLAARRACYRYLRTERKWTHGQIALFFNRSVQTIRDAMSERRRLSSYDRTVRRRAKLKGEGIAA